MLPACLIFSGPQGPGGGASPFIWFRAQGRPSSSTCLGARLLIIAAAAAGQAGAGGPPGLRVRGGSRDGGGGGGEGGGGPGQAGLPPGAPSAQSRRGLSRKSSRNSQPRSAGRPGCWKPPGPPLSLSFPAHTGQRPQLFSSFYKRHSEQQEVKREKATIQSSGPRPRCLPLCPVCAKIAVPA